MKKVALATVCLATLFFGSGCKVVVTASSTYETCFSTSDCSDAFDSCVPVTNGAVTDRHCSRSCTFDSDCPFGGACVDFGTGGGPSCLQSCVTSTRCEPGWSCTLVTDGATEFGVCLPGTTTPPVGSPTYGPCATDSQCASAADACVDIEYGGLVGSQCTRACTADAQCPNGVCEGGVCLEACASNAMCELGWGCTTVSFGGGACLPGEGDPIGIPPYNECPFGANPDQCSTLSQGCFRIDVDGAVPAGVCTSECNSSAECPITPSGRAGSCVQYLGSPRICFETCATDLECLDGFSCKPTDVGSSTRICLPT